MEQLKEALLVQGLELQGQEQLIDELVVSRKETVEKLGLSDVYKDVKTRLLKIKAVLRGNTTSTSLEAPLTITEFDHKQLAPMVQKSVSDIEQDARNLNYEVESCFVNLKKSVDKLGEFGLNVDSLYVALHLFATQMQYTLSRLSSLIERKEVVEDLFKYLKGDQEKDD